jgi:hypothetical protein
MTAKEKAMELYSKFFIITPQPYTEQVVNGGNYDGLKFQDWDRDHTVRMAKQCALITVDEILDGFRKILPSSRNYWEEVKTEITNL